MSSLPDTSRQHTAILSQIAEQLAETRKRSEQLVEVMAQIPIASHATNTALAGLERRLDAASQADHERAKSLQAVGASVGGIATSSGAQAHTLRQLGSAYEAQFEVLKQVSAANEKRDDRWADSVRQQNNRFTLFFGITIALAIIALGMAGLHAFLEFGR